MSPIRPLALAVCLLIAAAPFMPGATATGDPPPVPPVCGDFYNWCDALVREVVDTVKEPLCQADPSLCL